MHRQEFLVGRRAFAGNRAPQSLAYGVNGYNFAIGRLELPEEDRRYGSGGKLVAMVQAAEPWERENLATRGRILRHRAACGSLLVQAQMSPVIVVVADVLVYQALQVAFIENDHMIEQIAAAASDESFGNAVLPGALQAGALGLNAEVQDLWALFASSATPYAQKYRSRGEPLARSHCLLLS